MKTVLTDPISFTVLIGRAADLQNAVPCPSTSPDPGGRKAGWPDGGIGVVPMGAGLGACGHVEWQCMHGYLPVLFC